VQSEENQATATGTWTKYLVKAVRILSCVSRQTNRETNILITVLCTPLGGKEMTALCSRNSHKRILELITSKDEQLKMN